MKIDMKFDNSNDYELFTSLLSRVFKNIEIKKNRLGKYSYHFNLNNPVKVGRPTVVVSNSTTNKLNNLFQQGRSINSISNELHISRRQIYNILNEKKGV